MKEVLDTLFVKYLEDSCSEAEIRTLLEHFKIPENEGRLKQFILMELESQDELDSPFADVDQRLQAIYNRVQTNIQTKSLPQKSFVRMAWFRVAAAAAVFILIGTSVFYYNQKQSATALQQKITKNHITPGRNRAILILANGNKIVLNDTTTGPIASQSGITIVKSANGQLVYNASAIPTGRDTAVSFNTLEVPVGGQWQVILPDKSHVWLNALSSITYPTRFTGKERRIKLSGEAYFEVAHNKDMPFKVESRAQTVEVLGTHFNIMAYSDEKVIKTTLLEGSVKISDYGKTEVIKPGEQAQVSDAELKIADDVDLEDVIAWKNGYFKFNENLEAIMSKIARWYDVRIVYESKPDTAYTFEGEISRTRDLSEILKIIEYTGKVHFAVEGRRIIVKK